MQALGTLEIAGLFHHISRVFAEKRDILIALDSLVGDGDLGITMSKGFAAACDAVARLEDARPALQVKTAGAALAKAAPSTMGTLMATGLLRGSVPLEMKDQVDLQALAAFWRAFSDGVALRGRAQVGDKTVLDVLQPIAEEMEQQAASGASISDALIATSKTAAKALDATKLLVAQHGKAAAFQEKSRGNVDAGATVGLILIEAMRDFVLEADCGTIGTGEARI